MKWECKQQGMNNTGKLMNSSAKEEFQAIGSHDTDYHEADTITSERGRNAIKTHIKDNKMGYNINVRLQMWQAPHDETELT